MRYYFKNVIVEVNCGGKFTRKVSGISFVDDKNPYMSAFISLKCDLLVIKELNAIVPEALKHFASEKETLVRMSANLSQKMKKGEFVESELNEFLERTTEKLEAYKKLSQFVSKVKARTKKKGYFGFDGETEVGRTLFNEIRYRVFPEKFITFIRNMSLVYLVALFEDYLRKVLQVVMENEPKIMMTS